MKPKVNTMTTWIKEPASWLSLVAAVVSASTFYLVYADKGSLTVLLPDRVSIAAQEQGLAVVIPLVFTNTGAARRHRHVVDATANLLFVPSGQVQQRSIPLRWEYEAEFVSRSEFRRRYPWKYDEKADKLVDHADYVHRAVPFHLAGGTSLVKTYQFEPSDRSLRVLEIGPFEIRLQVRTETETFDVSGKYRGPGELNAGYSWSWRE